MGSAAIATGIEAGYNILDLIPTYATTSKRLFVFGRYDYYDSQYKMERDPKHYWCGRQRVAAGINYYPRRRLWSRVSMRSASSTVVTTTNRPSHSA